MRLCFLITPLILCSCASLPRDYINVTKAPQGFVLHNTGLSVAWVLMEVKMEGTKWDTVIINSQIVDNHINPRASDYTRKRLLLTSIPYKKSVTLQIPADSCEGSIFGGWHYEPVSLTVLDAGDKSSFLSLAAQRAENPQATSWAAIPVYHSRILRLYVRLEAGMTREQVEAIVGKAISTPLRQPNGEEECWYIDKSERHMEPHESPWGVGGIKVIYKNGKLLRKQYNHQWVKHLENVFP